MSYASQIQEIINILQNERWNKGSYFEFNESTGKICYCVHGAAQAVCNPKVRKALSLEDKEMAFGGPSKRAAGGAARGAAGPAAFEAAYDQKDLKTLWQDRPSWVFENTEQGNLNLHYLLGMFGITTRFNDDPETTLPDLLAKLEEVKVWASENEEFLNSN